MRRQAAGSSPDPGTDAGFTLIETLVAIGIITVVMGSTAAFYLSGTSVSRQQTETQAAVRTATSAMERVHLLSGSAVISGRTEAAVNSQWIALGVAPYLDAALTAPVWSTDPAIPGMSLPTAPETVKIAGSDTLFQQSWYVGQCWALPTDPTCRVVATALRPSRIPMYRVIVAVTWPDSGCVANLCSYVTTTLTAADSTDPTFR